MTDEQDESQAHDSQSSFQDLMQFILETNPASQDANAVSVTPSGQTSVGWANPTGQYPVTNIEEYLNCEAPDACGTSSSAVASVKLEHKVDTSPDSGYVQPQTAGSVANANHREPYFYGHSDHSHAPKLYEIPQQPMTPSVPPKTNYPGQYDFKTLFEHTEYAAKNVNYTYSHDMKKLYTKMMIRCPIQFCCSQDPPHGSSVRAMMVFLPDEHSQEFVSRCPSHMMKPDPRPHLARHLIQTVVPQYGYDPAIYDEYTFSRTSVIVPHTKPSVGERHFTVVYKFMCGSSCHGGINRRPVGVVFTLEDNTGMVLGRCCTEVKICSAPGRDRIQDEKRKRKAGQGPAPTKTHTPLPKKPKTQVVETLPEANVVRSGECYLLRVEGREKYELLKKVNEALSLAELATEAQREQVRHRDDNMFKEILSSYLEKSMK